MSIPQIDNEGRNRRDLKGDTVVWALKFFLVAIMPGWLALCLSSMILTPVGALMANASYADAWGQTALVTGIVMYILVGVFLLCRLDFFRED